MSRTHRVFHLSAGLALAAALSACQAPATVAPTPTPEAQPTVIKGRFEASEPHGYRTQYHESIGPVGLLIKKVQDHVDRSVHARREYWDYVLNQKKQRFELLAEGGDLTADRLDVGADGSWQIEVPAGPVTLKLLLSDGSVLPLTFASGKDASHWLKIEGGKTYDLGLLSAAENKGTSEHNPLGQLDTDSDGTPDAEDEDDDGDGTPDVKETGAMRYDAAETADTDRDGLGDNSDPSPTDAGFRGAENLKDGDGDGLLDLDDLDGDGKLDQTVLDYVFV